MEIPRIPDGEYRFAELVWDNEPINSTMLIRLAQESLGWKKATSYTVLRKLCEKGILKNENATVTARIKKDAVCRQESEYLLHRSFGNSLPAFVASFLQDKKLTLTTVPVMMGGKNLRIFFTKTPTTAATIPPTTIAPAMVAMSPPPPTMACILGK